MTAPRLRDRPTVPAASPAPRTSRWLLFVHQLPSSPSNLRVRTWRRLQQIGALPVRPALYVLPDTAAAREDFEWLKAEIEAAGGQASVFAGDGVDAWSNDALVEEFRRTREASYLALARELDRWMARAARSAKEAPPRRVLRQIRERLAAVERVDFFGSAGRDRVVTLLQQLEQRGGPRVAGSRRAVPADYRGCLWMTRARPGVDRMASAWLIRRFIDPKARFGFLADGEAAPRGAVPFDMFGVEFTHRGALCTFELLCDVFQLQDPALPSLAAIVHDLDFKDARFGAPDAPTVGLVIEGLRLTHDDDEVLLDRGMALFESLYRGLAEAHRLQGPRPVAAPRARRAPGRGARRRR